MGNIYILFLAEERFEVLRDYDRPDFIVRKGEHEIAVEAVIVDRKKDKPPMTSQANVKPIEETRRRIAMICL